LLSVPIRKIAGSGDFSRSEAAEAATTKLFSDRFLVLFVILLAFALRSFRLGHQSVWYDEGLSIYYAQQSLPALLTGVSASDHPPLYFLLLHSWLKVVGSSEFSVRFLSLIWGLLLVSMTYRIGRRLLGSAVGLTAALLVAISPFHVWYSQETRMYTMAAFLALLSSYWLWQALQEGRWPTWVAYVLSSVALVYTHFFAWFVLLFQAAFVIWWAWQERRRMLLARWCLGQGVTLLAFLPWMPFVVGQYLGNATYYPGPLRVSSVLPSILSAFALGQTVSPSTGFVIGLIYLLLALIGTWHLRSRESPMAGDGSGSWQDSRESAGDHRLAFLLLYVVVPLLFLLLLTSIRPKFAPRYLLLVTPAFYLLAGEGLLVLISNTSPNWQTTARQGMGVLTTGLLLGGTLLSLHNLYFDSTYAKDDFRGVTSHIQANAKEGDAVIVVSGYVHPAFAYYNRGLLPYYALPSDLLLSLTEPLDRQTVSDTLNLIAQKHQRAWLVLWHDMESDPERLVLNQLVSYAPRLDVGRWGGRGILLLLFSLAHRPHFAPEPEMQHHLGANFGDQVELVGYDLTRDQWMRDIRQELVSGTRGDKEMPPLRFKPGETIHLALYWRARRSLAQDYTAFTHLLSSVQHIYGQVDRQLGGDRYPSSRWPMGEIFLEEYPIVVLPGTPPGRYTIEVGLYLRSTMERLPLIGDEGVVQGDHLLLAEIEVARGRLPLEAFAFEHPVGESLDGLTLVGCDYQAEVLSPGEAMRFTLFWQSGEEISIDYELAVRLLREEGDIIYEGRDKLADGLYPTSSWVAGEIVRDIHSLVVPSQAAPGRYRIQVRLVSGGDWFTLPSGINVR
ncbi:MAG: glycosyltransferase family 39 protein, partial [Anaerolineae bacterium]